MMRWFLAAICGLFMAQAAHAVEIKETTDKYAPFGKLHLYQISDAPKQVVLFVSGDGGWNQGVIDMAKAIVTLDTLVVGFDINYYAKDLNKPGRKCNYAAAQLEGLSQYLQKKYHFKEYQPPVLVGYSSGATVVYATLAQAPANTFAGGISLGFCPDLYTAKPFCKGNGTLTSTPSKKLGFVYAPADSVASPWVVVQGDKDEVCSTPKAKEYVAKVQNATFSEVEKVGHGFAKEENWMPAFTEAFEMIVEKQKASHAPAPKAAAVKDLPLVELPLETPSETIAIVISGDGGWASIDKELGDVLNKDGIPVIGLNSLKYFWEKKTPDIAGSDLARMMAYYSEAWNAHHFILIGYSRGADVLPFMVSRLPEDMKTKVQSVALLGAEREVDFEFHMGDWIASADGQYKVVPEIEKISTFNPLCIYGSDESSDSACTALKKTTGRTIQMKGGHHFGGDYEKLAKLILEHSKQ